jgi:hypothetical protein
VALVDRMAALARTMPGYISHKGFFTDDGERVMWSSSTKKACAPDA